MRRALALLALASATACGAEPGGDGDADAAPDAAVFDTELVWYACEFHTGRGGNDAECTGVDVPASWDDPAGPTIRLFLKRLGDYNAAGQQLWFLMGGPGGASDGYEDLAEQLLGADPTLNVYLLDHRGTGRSSRLSCPEEEAEASEEGSHITMNEWPTCIMSLQSAWGARLPYFSTTMAARDLGFLIEKTRAPGQRVHVHGGSYGTFWAQRYLQIYPAQPTAVSMLGVVHPTFSFTNYDQQYEDVGKLFLDECKNDSFCTGKLGSDPETFLRSVMSDIGGTCPEALAAGLDRETLRRYQGAQLLFGWDERVLGLAIAYRINRCAAADITALQTFASNMSNPIDTLQDNRLFSVALGNHVGLSDLWEAPIPTLQQAQALIDDALFAIGSTRRLELADDWPTYPEDQYADVFADTSVPILMMNGELDPASTLAQALPVGEHFSGPNQHFVTFPRASHSWTTPTTEGYGCALNMFFNFLTDPLNPLLDCETILSPIGFAGTTELASLFGTTDLWENVGTAQAVHQPTLDQVRSNVARAFAQR